MLGSAEIKAAAALDNGGIIFDVGAAAADAALVGACTRGAAEAGVAFAGNTLPGPGNHAGREGADTGTPPDDGTMFLAGKAPA